MCASILPGLVQAKEEFSSEGLHVLALNLAPQVYSIEEVLDYGQSLGAGSLSWAQDEEVTIARAYGVRGLGETVVVDRRGAITGRFRSVMPYQDLKGVVQQAGARQ